MSTFNFREAVHSVRTEEEFWKLAIKSGASIQFYNYDPKEHTNYGYKFVNLGDLEGYDAFIEKGVLARFNVCSWRDGFSDFDTPRREEIAFTALFKAYHAFQKFDGSWIDSSKPSEFTYEKFYDLIWKNMESHDFRIGKYTHNYVAYPENMEKIPELARELNMGMNEVAVWCGMDACFASSNCGDYFRAEDERGEKHLCEDYVHGIAMYFETKKRKRDDADDAEEEDQ